MNSVTELSYGEDSVNSSLPYTIMPPQEKNILKRAAKDKYKGNFIRREKRDYQNTRKEEIKVKIPLPPFRLAFQNRRSIEDFQYLNMIAEGAFGAVYRARDRRTNEIVALKRIKTDNRNEGFFVAAMRELKTLLKIQHPNVVAGREIAVGSSLEEVFIVMDYVPHDLKSYMETMRRKRQLFTPAQVKCLMTQLLTAVQHLHENWILHRDLKTSNILLSHEGVLKLADFGLARDFEYPVQQLTPVVVTLWYRAPEILLVSQEYSTPIDMWSVGCIFAELITLRPLFPGRSEIDQLNRIFEALGTPTDTTWPGFSELPGANITFAKHPTGRLREIVRCNILSEDGLCLLQDFLTYDPRRRITAEAALNHWYFKEQPVAIEPAKLPTWPAKSEGSIAARQLTRLDLSEALDF